MLPQKAAVVRPRRVGGVVRRVSMVEEVSYYVGKGIMLFTMFYCGMNWYHYREVRKQMEEDEENKDKDGGGNK